jgi:ParB/RepB/Spo0J family partition protein
LNHKDGLPEVRLINIDLIAENSYNPNVMSEEGFQALIHDLGHFTDPATLDPITVRPAGGDKPYEVIDGAHRLRAARAAGWDRIPVRVLQVDEDTARVLNYRKNRERGTLDPIKEAELFKAEREKGLSLHQIAEKYGVSHGHVASRLRLLKQEVVTRVTTSIGLSASHLEELGRLDDLKQAEALAKLVKERGLNVQQTREAVNMLKEGLGLKDVEEALQPKPAPATSPSGPSPAPSHEPASPAAPPPDPAEPAGRPEPAAVSQPKEPEGVLVERPEQFEEVVDQAERAPVERVVSERIRPEVKEKALTALHGQVEGLIKLGVKWSEILRALSQNGPPTPELAEAGWIPRRCPHCYRLLGGG